MNKNKSLLRLVLMSALWLGIAVPLCAANTEITWSDKLGRGVLNMVGSPVELARTIHIQSNLKGPAYGWTMGIVNGLGGAFVRFGSGAIDTLTCPFNFPTKDKSPLLTPTYPWDEWDVQASRK